MSSSKKVIDPGNGLSRFKSSTGVASKPTDATSLRRPLGSVPASVVYGSDRRLDELVELGSPERTQYDEIPPWVAYEPTDRLVALRPMFRELRNWMETYGAEPIYHDEE